MTPGLVFRQESTEEYLFRRGLVNVLNIWTYLSKHSNNYTDMNQSLSLKTSEVMKCNQVKVHTIFSVECEKVLGT